MISIESKSVACMFNCACCVGPAVCVQVIELPLKHPELFESLGIAQPKVRLWLHVALLMRGKGFPVRSCTADGFQGHLTASLRLARG
jgi:hypothetical protein